MCGSVSCAVSCLTLTVLLGCLTVGHAHAQSIDEEAARTHFESGRLHLDRGDYAEAIREFEAAYELSHRAELLYNLYLASERFGQTERAIAFLDQYLREASIEEERRAQLTDRLANLRARHERAMAEARERAEPSAPPEPDPAPSGEFLPAAIAYAVTGLGLVGFAVFGGLALAEDDRLTSFCATHCSDADVGALGTYNLAADVSWITAASAAVVGTVLLVVFGFPQDESAPTARAWVTPDGAGLAVGGTL